MILNFLRDKINFIICSFVKVYEVSFFFKVQFILIIGVLNISFFFSF